MRRSPGGAGGVRARRPEAAPNLPLETLEPRLHLAASSFGLRPAETATRVSAKLLALHDNVVHAGMSPVDAAAADRIMVDDRGRVGVTVRGRNVAAASAALRPIGFRPTASYPKLHFVEGLLPISSLAAVSDAAREIPHFAVRPNYVPLTLAGAVNSQGDFVHEADRVRATSPGAFNGTGVTVGVLSDSFDRLGGAAGDIASGDLPAAGVQVIAESPAAPSNRDEGRALLQVVHDLAPGAALAFATGAGSQGTLANNIRTMAGPTVGAKVIVDDVLHFGEPMFQDGVIAQAIDEVVTTRGVAYFAAAGNHASQAYESTTFTTSSDTLSYGTGFDVPGSYYDFDPSAGATDTRQLVTIPAGGRIAIELQWDDPFYTLNGVDTDLDLYLVNHGTGRIVAGSESDNRGVQEPFEVLGYTNTTAAPVQLAIAINRVAGPNPGRVKYVNYGDGFLTFDEFGTNSPAVVPHAAAANARAVGAVPYFDQADPEPFTSKGPSTFLFSPTGARLATPEVRQGPRLAGIDRVDNTFFGSDFENNGRPNFAGTSAAAAHVGAIAALVRQANPSFTPAGVYTRLQDTADDVGVPGFDALTGYGLVNAYDAVYPAVAPAATPFADGFEGGVLSAAYETRSTGSGRIRVTGDHAPFAGTRHLALDTSVGVLNPDGTPQLGLNEVTLHVNAAGGGSKVLSFRQREFGDEDHEMPPTFAGSSNSDGVALSVDGVNWVRLVSLTGASSNTTYREHKIDLTAAAAAAGVTLTTDTRIRFQQYDDFPVTADGMVFDEIRVTTAAPPRVTDVFVSGSTWTPAYRHTLQASGAGEAAYGYRIKPGEQTRTMAWSNLNRVGVRFSEAVNVAADDLKLTGVNVPAYTLLAGTEGFTYDPATLTATWTFSRPIANDKVTINLDGDDGPDGTGMTDLDGYLLDGEWSNPVPPSHAAGRAFPSGDGLIGGDFVFALRVLPGDVNRDGAVNVYDYNVLRPNLNQTGQGVAGGDLDGDNLVDLVDFNIYRANLNRTAPA